MHTHTQVTMVHNQCACNQINFTCNHQYIDLIIQKTIEK
jgi:hypothetical protein